VSARRPTPAAAAANARAATTFHHPSSLAPWSDDDRGARRPSPVRVARPLLEHLPDLFQQEVLRRLGPTDLASLAGAGRGCAAAVAASALMQWAERAKMGAALAAEGGYLEVLQWTVEHGCPWDSRTCTCAARAGQLEVLQWMREYDATGKVWNENTVRTYAGGPMKQEVLTWLDELDAP
jgi:hypothetical protein